MIRQQTYQDLENLKSNKMQNQFFYTRTESSNGEEKTFVDSFNINKVVRSLTLEDSRVLVLLDDLHERAHEVPDIDMKNNRVKGVKRVKDIFQSEIYLSVEDGARFKQVTSIA